MAAEAGLLGKLWGSQGLWGGIGKVSTGLFTVMMIMNIMQMLSAKEQQPQQQPLQPAMAPEGMAGGMAPSGVPAYGDQFMGQNMSLGNLGTMRDLGMADEGQMAIVNALLGR